MSRTRDVAKRFGAAAATYDANAGVQAEVARRLDRRLDGLVLAEGARVLEIGCGTGFLTTALVRRFPQAKILATDISPAMIACCQAGVSAGNIAFAVMDGQAPAIGEVDLIVSSLAFQWFADPGGALARWAACLRPGGRLEFATLGAGTFREWRDAHATLGLPCGVPLYPDASALRRLHPGLTVSEEDIRSHHRNALEFPRALKAIGAGLAAESHRPLTPGELRRVLRHLDEGGPVAMTYHVLYGHVL